MITMGPALAGIGVLAGIMFLWKRRLYESRFVLWLLVLTVFIGEATITAGWWTGEIGRQPWLVYNVLTTADGHSPVLAAIDVVLSLGMFLILYGLLLVLFLYLLNRKIHDGPEELEDVETVPMSSLPDTFRDVFTPQPARRRPGRRAMTLNDVWFFLFILIIAGYLILDGFDMGVGILLLPMARTDTERRILLNSIGPVWDGNEVWLVLGAGVLFAVFPLAYASLFSGLYLAFVLVLLVMILRTVALEFRSKEPGRRWRSAWDTVFAVASTGLAFLLGVAFGNIVDGLPLDAQGNISTGLIGLLTPFTLLVGVTTVAMFAMQGGIYLLIKTEGELHDRLQRTVPRLMIAFFVLNTFVVVALAVLHPNISERYLDDIWPALFPTLALVALGAAWVFVRRGEPFRAFLASSATIGLLLISGGVGLYPNLIISTTDTAYNLTIFNAASADNTLV